MDNFESHILYLLCENRTLLLLLITTTDNNKTKLVNKQKVSHVTLALMGFMKLTTE